MKKYNTKFTPTGKIKLEDLQRHPEKAFALMRENAEWDFSELTEVEVEFAEIFEFTRSIPGIKDILRHYGSIIPGYDLPGSEHYKSIPNDKLNFHILAVYPDTLDHPWQWHKPEYRLRLMPDKPPEVVLPLSLGMAWFHLNDKWVLGRKVPKELFVSISEKDSDRKLRSGVEFPNARWYDGVHEIVAFAIDWRRATKAKILESVGRWIDAMEPPEGAPRRKQKEPDPVQSLKKIGMSRLLEHMAYKDAIAYCLGWKRKDLYDLSEQRWYQAREECLERFKALFPGLPDSFTPSFLRF